MISEELDYDLLQQILESKRSASIQSCILNYPTRLLCFSVFKMHFSVLRVSFFRKLLSEDNIRRQPREVQDI
jgi:hypothetical protein